MTRRSGTFRPVRPLREFDSTAAVPFDPRTPTFIPVDSVMSEHIHGLVARKVRLLGAKVYRSTAQTITTATDTNIQFDTEVFDQGDLFKSTANTRLTIGVPGVYNVAGYAEFVVNAVGDRVLKILKNGATAVAASGPTPTGPNARVSVAAPMRLAAGDYLQLEVRQTSGGDLDVNASENSNFLSAILQGTI